MVKRQKEKQYQSSVEHKLNSQIRSGGSSGTNQARPLPFDCCALTLTSFTNPVCCILSNDDVNNTSIDTLNNKHHSRRGIIFENADIIPYILKHGKNPIDGSKMSTQDLITLNMEQDEDDDADDNKKNGGNDDKKRWQCPILNKPFMNHTKIVAIRTGNSANVYSFEAVQTLNLKAKNYMDLISGTKFSPKKDVIILNDVNDDTLKKWRDINNFVHLELLRKNHQSNNQNTSGNVNLSISAKRVMDKFQSNQKDKEKEEDRKKKMLEKRKREDTTAAGNIIHNLYYKKMKILSCDLGITYTKGQASGSFTSTSLASYHNHANNTALDDVREATEEEILTSLFLRMKKMKQKAFVRMMTNVGFMDIELYCHIAPRTCMNFIKLVESGWYDGKHFHRLIRNFMIQGGGCNDAGKSVKKKKKMMMKQPNSKEGEKEEQSIWGHSFQDEFDQRLKHTGPGILSMANAGPNTNKCQFFITFKTAPHLDNKHSIFGKVIKGLDVLSTMENIPTNKNDVPLEDIYIEKMVLFGDNHLKEAEETEKKSILIRIEEREKTFKERKGSALGQPKAEEKTSSTSYNETKPSVPQVGRYLQNTSKKKGKKSQQDATGSSVVPSRLPPPPTKTKFGDFSGW